LSEALDLQRCEEICGSDKVQRFRGFGVDILRERAGRGAGRGLRGTEEEGRNPELSLSSVVAAG